MWPFFLGDGKKSMFLREGIFYYSLSLKCIGSKILLKKVYYYYKIICKKNVRFIKRIWEKNDVLERGHFCKNKMLTLK